MARVVRRVENKNSRGKGKNYFWFLRKKLFWFITAGLVLTAGIIVTICLIVYYLNLKNPVYVEDYFAQTQEYKTSDGKTHEVTFTKTSYGQARLHTAQDSTISVEHVFVFAGDLSQFYPFDLYDDTDGDGDYDDNLKNSTHEQVFNALIKLQYLIDLYNDEMESIESTNRAALYIVDTGNATTNKTSNSINRANNNALIYSDSSFVVLGDSESDDEEEITGPLFSYHNATDGLIVAYSGYKGGDYKEYDKDNSTTKPGLSIYGAGSYDSILTPISNSAKYINLGFENEEEGIVDEDTEFVFGTNPVDEDLSFADVNLTYASNPYSVAGLTVDVLTSNGTFEAVAEGHKITAEVEISFYVNKDATVVIETKNGAYTYDAKTLGNAGAQLVTIDEIQKKTKITITFNGEDVIKSIKVTY